MKPTLYIFKNLPDSIDDSSAPWADLIREDFHIAVYLDKYPCTQGHLLFVPKFNSMAILLEAFNDAMTYGQSMVKDNKWDGFNIGMNYGNAAGQTVDWPHVHLIPRQHGDVDDPTGGIRNIIPGMGNYHK
jgi:ATP adenylyltransferase